MSTNRQTESQLAYEDMLKAQSTLAYWVAEMARLGYPILPDSEMLQNHLEKIEEKKKIWEFALGNRDTPD